MWSNIKFEFYVRVCVVGSHLHLHEGKTLLTKGKTLVTKGKTLVNKGKTLVNKGKTLGRAKNIFTKNIFFKNIFTKNIFVKVKNIQIIFQMDILSKIFPKKYSLIIFPEKIFSPKIFLKKYLWQLYFWKKVEAKPSCCPQGLGW